MKIYIYISLLAVFASCGEKQDKELQNQDNMEMHRQKVIETYVDTMILHRTEFNKQIICNGRLRAKAKSEVNFAGQGIIADVLVREGQHVAKGQLIATMDNKEKQHELEKAEHELERAKVELTDKLIGLGYDDLETVPSDIMQRTEVTTGYYSAKYQLQTARKALENCNLYAPFSGRVANLEAKKFQRNDKVCTLVDDSGFEVEFRILEAELAIVKVGQKVRVSPFVEESLNFDGTLSEINPLVDDKGLVRIIARLANRGDQLLDGMNVRVVVEEKVQDTFVVPKDAVVERDGYNVIFLLEEGKAAWTYVDIVHSNINSYAINGCKRKETTINDGDIVIVSGNLNLADGTEVKVNNINAQ